MELHKNIFIDVTSISFSKNVTVGAGGAGNATSSGVRYGNGGGTSSFGSHCSATGGGAGTVVVMIIDMEE